MTIVTRQLKNNSQFAGIMQVDWNKRYAENASVYGTAPNLFFKKFIDAYKASTILLPAEGEGRNALYAAAKGWSVHAFDVSNVAATKALQRAKELALNIDYEVSAVEDFTTTKKYDVIALIYVHLPEALRRSFHKKLVGMLNPGGFIILEGFCKDQLQYQSGGPKDEVMLYDSSTLCTDFQMLHMISCRHQNLVLDEGPFHQGEASVVQMIAQKL